ncbi:25S rRNA (uridine(2634)-N(3))-methyltransferase [Hyphodiscus hymeniophilus]|uniref:25S rRNA (Uridine(2634)-N(3))-methyltransferase n=1 Tax=Hyphodiscus hymeniophilus TaxID=353542 RepID=A0A9P6VRU3_9HELO|nr:25S rRNA (uridine(2634)-N(3))-methyltransferase [Hyphodiscus hymeniophilus]
MGKNKRQKLQPGSKKQKHNAITKGARPSGIIKSNPTKKPPSKKHVQVQHSQPTIPFTPTDRILLVGEGDLSFARSLVEHHNCSNVTATVFENCEDLQGKYPHVRENVRFLEENRAKVLYGVDALKVKGKAGLGGVGIGTVDRVVFNFPHVGGKSTDVNRQVRYNQGMQAFLNPRLIHNNSNLLSGTELLVSFFKNALPALAPSTAGSTSSVIVTLFEGDPYTLWNIRDLARHSGLQVEKSFKFQAKAYPGYQHARTLGVVKGKNGEAGGGWKGEERAARSFIFVRKGEAPVPGMNGGAREKQSESSNEDSAEELESNPAEEAELKGSDEHHQDGEEGEYY